MEKSKRASTVYICEKGGRRECVREKERGYVIVYVCQCTYEEEIY